MCGHFWRDPWQCEMLRARIEGFGPERGERVSMTLLDRRVPMARAIALLGACAALSRSRRPRRSMPSPPLESAARVRGACPRATTRSTRATTAARSSRRAATQRDDESRQRGLAPLRLGLRVLQRLGSHHGLACRRGQWPDLRRDGHRPRTRLLLRVLRPANGDQHAVFRRSGQRCRAHRLGPREGVTMSLRKLLVLLAAICVLVPAATAVLAGASDATSDAIPVRSDELSSWRTRWRSCATRRRLTDRSRSRTCTARRSWRTT